MNAAASGTLAAALLAQLDSAATAPQGGGADTDGTKWILFGVAMLAIMYFVLRPMMRKRRGGSGGGGGAAGGDPLERSVSQAALARQRTVEREMSNLLVELTEMTRQVSAQLDTRAARLEVLIRQADERIATLEALRDGNGEFRSPPPKPPDEDRRDTPARRPAVEVDPRHAEVYTLADQGSPPHEIAARLGRPSGEVELILALRPKAV